MKKIFIVAGELSGDKIGAWYAHHLKNKDNSIEIHAVGGDFLKSAGARLHDRFERLNFVGLIEIVKHLRFIFSFMNKLVHHIVSNRFDEVVVVDFPGFNLRLIKKIKKLDPSIKITYVSPPQLWAWGESRYKKIKKFCDKVVVIYPFEVDWYKKRGIDATWLGYPFYSELEPYFDARKRKENLIAIIPGSRTVEIERLLPLFLNVVKRLGEHDKSIRFALPLAESIDKKIVKKHLDDARCDVDIVEGEEKKREVLSRCCLAITKPGTITLELALLGLPAVVAYKASWFTYRFAKSIVKIEYMALPNLFLPSPVYQEFIQADCTPEKIYAGALKLYKSFLANDDKYRASQEKLHSIREMLYKKI